MNREQAMKKSLSIVVVILIFMTCMACTETAEKWIKKGENAYSTKNSDEAIECYKKAKAIDPDNGKPYYFLGWIYKSEGMLDEAISEFKKAIVIDPNNKNLHNLLGETYHAKGMWDEAISEYKKAIAIDPNNKNLHNLLGETYLAKGMLDEAISEFKKVIAKAPDFAVAHYNLGIAYRKQGQNTQADKHLNEAGLLAFVQSDGKAALKICRGLEGIGSEKLAQELCELLAPLIESELKGK